MYCGNFSLNSRTNSGRSGRGPTSDISPAEHVDELRQLVEAPPPQEAPSARAARVVGARPGRARLLLGADDHRAELEDVEGAAVQAHAALPVEDRRRRRTAGSPAAIAARAARARRGRPPRSRCRGVRLTRLIQPVSGTCVRWTTGRPSRSSTPARNVMCWSRSGTTRTSATVRPTSCRTASIVRCASSGRARKTVSTPRSSTIRAASAVVPRTGSAAVRRAALPGGVVHEADGAQSRPPGARGTCRRPRGRAGRRRRRARAARRRRGARPPRGNGGSPCGPRRRRGRRARRRRAGPVASRRSRGRRSPAPRAAASRGPSRRGPRAPPRRASGCGAPGRARRSSRRSARARRSAGTSR